MSDTKAEDIRLVVLQRGWVAYGRYSQDGDACYLRGGGVVRRWGTQKGLGEIAEGGPTKNTILDPTPEITFHPVTAVLTIRCVEAKWAAHLR